MQIRLRIVVSTFCRGEQSVYPYCSKIVLLGDREREFGA